MAWWTTFVLMLLYALSFLDRQIINLMVDDVKHTLHISDLQISLLQGFAFALFYSVLGLPFGWATDRGSRRAIIFGGLTIWSLAASACGLARSFIQLLGARLVLGAGEAALMPSAYSMLGDCFAYGRQALAMSVFTAGAGFGSALSFLLGGYIIHAVPASGLVLPWLGHLENWQIVFLVTGLPCFALSWIIFTVREPGRHARTSEDASVGAAVRFIAAHRSFFACHFLGFALLSLCDYGLNGWAPAYLHRHFGWEPLKIGTAFAVITGIGCTIGVAIMGGIADRWYRAGRTDAHMRLFVFAGVVQIITAVVAMSVDNAWVCVTFIGLTLATGPVGGLAATALQMVTPNQFRGQVTALYLLFYNAVAIGAGPSVVAAITDFVFHDTAKVGGSIALTFVLVMPLSIALLFAGLRPLRLKIAAFDQPVKATPR